MKQTGNIQNSVAIDQVTERAWRIFEKYVTQLNICPEIWLGEDNIREWLTKLSVMKLINNVLLFLVEINFFPYEDETSAGATNITADKNISVDIYRFVLCLK